MQSRRKFSQLLPDPFLNHGVKYKRRYNQNKAGYNNYFRPDIYHPLGCHYLVLNLTNARNSLVARVKVDLGDSKKIPVKAANH